MVETQFQTKIQVLHTEYGREFFNTTLGVYLAENGIFHQGSCLNTPQQNGVVERKNRHLLEVARAFMFTNNVPKYFLGEAVLTSSYLINRLPSRVLQYQKPLHILCQVYPQIRFLQNLPLKTFGCTVFVHSNPPQTSTLDPRAIKCIFLGYSPSQKGFKCYCPHIKKVFISMDVSFFENQAYYSKTSLQGENETCEGKFWDYAIQSESRVSYFTW